MDASKGPKDCDEKMRCVQRLASGASLYPCHPSLYLKNQLSLSTPLSLSLSLSSTCFSVAAPQIQTLLSLSTRCLSCSCSACACRKCFRIQGWDGVLNRFVQLFSWLELTPPTPSMECLKAALVFFRSEGVYCRNTHLPKIPPE